MKKQFGAIISLFAICAVTAILLAITNSFTAPYVKANEDKAVEEALLQVMPDGKDFEAVDISGASLPATVTDAYKESSGGYVFKLKTSGYASDFIIMCGVTADGVVSGAVCLSSGETLGHEKTYGDNFKGKDAESVNTVDTISGATKTTAAYRSAINDSLSAANTLKGGN